jgi:hypothetical protein
MFNRNQLKELELCLSVFLLSISPCDPPFGFVIFNSFHPSEQQEKKEGKHKGEQGKSSAVAAPVCGLRLVPIFLHPSSSSTACWKRL